jgi:hypothetical protein
LEERNCGVFGKSLKESKPKDQISATKYVLLEGELYYRTIDGVLLRCLDKEEAKVLMGEIHVGVCGSHQLAYKMKWAIRRNGYFWPTMLEDCFTYYKVVKGVRNLEMCREHRHRL